MTEKNNQHRNNFIKNDKDTQDKDSTEILAIQQALRGKREAFSIIVKNYTSVFYTLAYRMLGNAEDAKDAVQEIFLRVYSSLESFHLGKRFYPWIYTIAINCIRTYLKRKKRRSRNEILTKETGTENILSGNKVVGKDPFFIFELKECERVVQEAIMSLRTKYREVFILRHIEGLSTTDVAEILHIPEGTVKTYLHRARKQIIKKLFQEGWINGGQ